MLPPVGSCLLSCSVNPPVKGLLSHPVQGYPVKSLQPPAPQMVFFTQQC